MTDTSSNGTEQPRCSDCGDPATRVAPAGNARPNGRETAYCDDCAPEGSDPL